MSVTLKDLHEFRDDIIQFINECINGINNNEHNDTNQKIMNLIINHYYKIKKLYAIQSSTESNSDNDDFFSGIISENSSDDLDYTDIMENRVYRNPNNQWNMNDEDRIRKKILELSTDFYTPDNYPDNYTNDFSYYEPNINSSSHSESDNSENDTMSDNIYNDLEAGMYIINNIRKKVKDTPILEYEITDDSVDYDDPTF